MKDLKDIEIETKIYLDSMPPKSKVNYPDLVEYVCSKTGQPTKIVDAIVHSIVAARTDFMVLKGKGICKE